MPTTFFKGQCPANVEFLGQKPKVLVSPTALERMWLYVDLASEEVGWFGTVRRVGVGFLIEEVFLFEQEVSGTTTEISAQSLTATATEILSTRADGMEVVNALHFWGHSHVNMAVHPSGQDEAQMGVFRENDCEYFIRGIFNKRGEVRFDLFLYSIGVVIREVEWEVYQPVNTELRSTIEAEMAEKVRKLSIFTGHGLGFYSHHRHGQWGGEPAQQQKTKKRRKA